MLGLRSLAVLGCVLALSSHAPLQCGHEPDETLRRAETPAEALYGLATRFRDAGDFAAWRTTLEYLIERYPNSRFAVTARDDLDRADAGAGRH